jgi:hypothetical protein
MTVTRGVRNNNPGNIRVGSDWLGLADPADMAPAQKKERDFCVFTDPVYGIRALTKLLLKYQSKYHLYTVRQMIHRWAPPNENATEAYVKAVAGAMHVQPDDVVRLGLDRPALTNMVIAIIAHENAGYRYPDDVVEAGIRLAAGA